MSIKVLFFASLREQLGQSEVVLPIEPGETVSQVWERVSEGHSVATRVLHSINMQYVEPDAPVNDGDEVAFFPPVTGGAQ